MRKLLVLCFLIGFSLPLFSQLAIGPRVGYHFSNVSIDPDQDTENRNSLLFGGVIEIGLGEVLAIQPEVTYMGRGFGRELLGDNGDLFSSETTINYLDLGGIIKLRTSAENFGVYLGAGPYFSYALDGELAITVLGETTTTEIDFENDFNRTDINVALAAGINIPISDNSKIFLDGRSILGLVDVEARDDDTTINNRGIAVSAGILLGL